MCQCRGDWGAPALLRQGSHASEVVRIAEPGTSLRRCVKPRRDRDIWNVSMTAFPRHIVHIGYNMRNLHARWYLICLFVY